MTWKTLKKGLRGEGGEVEVKAGEKVAAQGHKFQLDATQHNRDVYISHTYVVVAAAASLRQIPIDKAIA